MVGILDAVSVPILTNNYVLVIFFGIKLFSIFLMYCSYRIGGTFHGKNISQKFHVLEKIIIHRKQKIYMVHILFLTDSRNFNPTKYTHIKSIVIYKSTTQ